MLTIQDMVQRAVKRAATETTNNSNTTSVIRSTGHLWRLPAPWRGERETRRDSPEPPSPQPAVSSEARPYTAPLPSTQSAPATVSPASSPADPAAADTAGQIAMFTMGASKPPPATRRPEEQRRALEVVLGADQDAAGNSAFDLNVVRAFSHDSLQQSLSVAAQTLKHRAPTQYQQIEEYLRSEYPDQEITPENVLAAVYGIHAGRAEVMRDAVQGLYLQPNASPGLDTQLQQATAHSLGLALRIREQLNHTPEGERNTGVYRELRDMSEDMTAGVKESLSHLKYNNWNVENKKEFIKQVRGFMQPGEGGSLISTVRAAVTGDPQLLLVEEAVDQLASPSAPSSTPPSTDTSSGAAAAGTAAPAAAGTAAPAAAGTAAPAATGTGAPAATGTGASTNVPSGGRSNVDQFIEDMAKPVTAAALKSIDDEVKKDFDWNGLGNWFMSNWQNFLVPASILSILFGGSIGRFLGAIGLIGGATNLYGRYQNLTGDPAKNPVAKHVQDAFASAVITVAYERLKNTDSKASPFANPEKSVDAYIAQLKEEDSVAANEAQKHRSDIIQGFHDMRIATSLGFADQIKKRIQEGERARVRRAQKAVKGVAERAQQAVKGVAERAQQAVRGVADSASSLPIIGSLFRKASPVTKDPDKKVNK